MPPFRLKRIANQIIYTIERNKWFSRVCIIPISKTEPKRIHILQVCLQTIASIFVLINYLVDFAVFNSRDYHVHL